MSSPRAYNVALSSSTDDAFRSRCKSEDNNIINKNNDDNDDDHEQQQTNRFSKRITIIATASLVLIAMGLAICNCGRKKGVLTRYPSNVASFSVSTTMGTKDDALNERMDALDDMQKKRKEEYPKKKPSLRSSSVVTQGGQLDSELMTKEDTSQVENVPVAVVSTKEGLIEVEDAEEDEDEGDISLGVVEERMTEVVGDETSAKEEEVLAEDDEDEKEMMMMTAGTSVDEEIKNEAMDKRMDALGYMDKKRQEEHPNKSSSLRASTVITQGQQLDPLLAKEDLAESGYNNNDPVVNNEQDDEEEGDDDSEDEEGDSEDEFTESKTTVNAALDDKQDAKPEEEDDSSNEALEKHLNALAYMDKNRHEERPKKAVSVRASSKVTQDQLDPLFAKEERERTPLSLGNHHVDSLAYMDKHPKDDTKKTNSLLVPSSSAAAAGEEKGESSQKALEQHLNALSYMDKKRQDERPQKTSLRSSSVVTTGQLDPLYAKEELEAESTTATTAAVAEEEAEEEDLEEEDYDDSDNDDLSTSQESDSSKKFDHHYHDHVDGLAYMDKKRQNERPQKTPSSVVTRGQPLDTQLAKEELETAVTAETFAQDVEDNHDHHHHVDGLAYMDKKRQDERPKRSPSSVVTRGQPLDPFIAKEELEITYVTEESSVKENHVDAYMDKKRQGMYPEKSSSLSDVVEQGQTTLDPIFANEDLGIAAVKAEIASQNLENHVDGLAYMDKKRQDGRSKTSASSVITRDHQPVDPSLFAKEELEGDKDALGAVLSTPSDVMISSGNNNKAMVQRHLLAQEAVGDTNVYPNAEEVDNETE